jgi:hypothetical protein
MSSGIPFCDSIKEQFKIYLQISFTRVSRNVCRMRKIFNRLRLKTFIILVSLEMITKQLIQEVSQYPEIWNPKHTLYHHRPRLNYIWSEISTKIGMPSKL